MPIWSWKRPRDAGISAGSNDRPRCCYYSSIRGFDVIRAGEVGLAKASDDGILEWAREHGRILVTRSSRSSFRSCPCIQ
ncbi:MAG: DUF5615 family PIN-like protein [Chloroflexi bacterium]|nr:DUF5615 family PIN-like protein [Chloroflexota bacterium]